MTTISIIGGGLAGLVAAITCAESGAHVVLSESHQQLGGRARSTDGPYIANQGPHALYSDGPLWAWLAERKLLDPIAAVPPTALARFLFRERGRLRHLPPVGVLRLLSRDRPAPVDQDFRTWATAVSGPRAADAAAKMIGVATFDADPGRLSAAFVWERLRRVFSMPPPARYVAGGWSRLIERLAEHASGLGVEIRTGARITELPDGPVIVATSLDAARRLLAGQDLGEVESGRTVLLDLGVTASRGDAFVVSDLDEAGWLERYTAADLTVAPPGESLIQAQLPMIMGESKAAALVRLERLVDVALPGWRGRVTWRQDSISNGRSGALDLPGRTWRDRPAVDRGHGVFLAGDLVAAPGLLGEVSFNSAVEAAKGALGSVDQSHSEPGTIKKES